jgi:hypothetical protein
LRFAKAVVVHNQKPIKNKIFIPFKIKMSFKLTYFNGRGLAEVSRLLFSATATPFEEKRYPISLPDYARPEFNADKHLFPMGQVN